jgi:hypothetical protein
MTALCAQGDSLKPGGWNVWPSSTILAWHRGVLPTGRNGFQDVAQDLVQERSRARTSSSIR